MEKEKRRKKPVVPPVSVDDSPIKSKASDKSSAPTTPSKHSRKTWSPNDFAGAEGEDLQALLAAEAAKGTPDSHSPFFTCPITLASVPTRRCMSIAVMEDQK